MMPKKKLEQNLRGTGVVPANNRVETFISWLFGKELTPKQREHMKKPFGMDPDQIKKKGEHALKNAGLM